jgi:hypothetical protein
MISFSGDVFGMPAARRDLSVGKIYHDTPSVFMS